MSGYLTIDAGVVARDASGHVVESISIVAVPAIVIPSSGAIGAIEHPRALYIFLKRFTKGKEFTVFSHSL